MEVSLPCLADPERRLTVADIVGPVGRVHSERVQPLVGEPDQQPVASSPAVEEPQSPEVIPTRRGRGRQVTVSYDVHAALPEIAHRLAQERTGGLPVPRQDRQVHDETILTRVERL